MKAIVTGANGFVGSSLVNYLVSKNIQVLAIDLKFTNDRVVQSNMVIKKELSIENINELLKLDIINEYDVFYHFAWIGSAGQLRTDENVQIQNALWTVKCLRICKDIGCKKFICAGSIMEFESLYNCYAQESVPSMPNIYSAGKVLAHQLCKPIANQIGVDLVWAYITNTFGVGEKSPRFINTTLRKIINNEELDFTSGIQNYDFIYIDDLVEAFYLLAESGKKNKSYLIGSGKAKKLKDYILEIGEIFGKKSKMHFGNIQYSGINLPLEIYSINEIERDCGFKCKVSFAEGIIKTKKWLETIDNE